MKKVLMAALLTMSATGAYADGLYGGAQFVSVEFEESTTGLSADLNGLGVIGGYRFNENFAVEARYITGLGDDTVLGVKTELQDYIGASLIGNLPLNDGFSLYGSLGYGNATVRLSDNTGAIEESDSSVSYGAGLQYKTGNMTFRAGYESLYDKDTLSAAGIGITALISF